MFNAQVYSERRNRLKKHVENGIILILGCSKEYSSDMLDFHKEYGSEETDLALQRLRTFRQDVGRHPALVALANEIERGEDETK